MNAAVHSQGKYKISESVTIGFCVDFANMEFDRPKLKEDNWKQDQKSKAKTGTEDQGKCRGCWYKLSTSINFVPKNSRKMDTLWSTDKSSTYTSGFIEHIQWISYNLWIWWYHKKSSGVPLYDVKTDHIPIRSQDQITTFKRKLQILALLASEGVTVEDLLEQINFWMSNRASDSNIISDNLGVDVERRLKCTTQFVLGTDGALENTFKSFEKKVGR